MPNMFGGDQFHPAYMPQDLPLNEFDVDNIHYRVDLQKLHVVKTYLDGNFVLCGLRDVFLPQAVRDYINE